MSTQQGLTHYWQQRNALLWVLNEEFELTNVWRICIEQVESGAKGHMSRAGVQRVDDVAIAVKVPGGLRIQSNPAMKDTEHAHTLLD